MFKLTGKTMSDAEKQRELAAQKADESFWRAHFFNGERQHHRIDEFGNSRLDAARWRKTLNNSAQNYEAWFAKQLAEVNEL